MGTISLEIQQKRGVLTVLALNIFGFSFGTTSSALDLSLGLVPDPSRHAPPPRVAAHRGLVTEAARRADPSKGEGRAYWQFIKYENIHWYVSGRMLILLIVVLGPIDF